MNNIKLQTLVNVMYHEITENMDKHLGTFIKLHDTTKAEAFEVINQLNEAFPCFSELKYLLFETNKGYCIVRVHPPGHEEKYNIELMEKYTYLYIDDALEDFFDIVYNKGYTNQIGIKVAGEIDEEDEMDGGDFIGQYLGIFKEDYFYYIAGITKETANEDDYVFPITKVGNEYTCDEKLYIDKFKDKPLKNKKLKYDKSFDYTYNRGGFIIEDYIHKFNRTHHVQIIKFEPIDLSD